LKDLKLQISDFALRRRAASRLALRALLLLLAAHCSLLTAAAAWVRQSSGTLAWLHAVYFLDESRGWAVGGKGTLLATVDGGAHWRAERSPTEDALRDIFFVDERTGWLVCERNIYQLTTKEEPRSYLLKTTDGGASWTRVEVMASADADVLLVRVRFAGGERGWAFGEAGALYATTDGGATWQRQRVPTRHLLQGGVFLDAQRGWVVGAGSTLLQTTDGGATWNAGRLETPAAPQASSQANAKASGAQAPRASTGASSVRFNAVSFVNERRGWAVGASGAAYATTNGGRSWHALSTGVEADLFDVTFYDEREGRATGGGGTVIHTTDGGATWQTEPTGTSHPLERLFFSGRARGWAVGFGGTIIGFRLSSPAPPKLP
jgi:photosystem II stability/assembly factor-like uncharacterized protein